MGVKVKDVPTTAKRGGTALRIISHSSLWFSLSKSLFFSVPVNWLSLLPSVC